MTIADDFPVEVFSDEGLFKNSDTPSASAYKAAAVLMPLVRVDNEWHFLYITRATNPNDRHSGQVAFPGGRAEDTDTSLEDTALRETYEEIGVPRDQIEIIGTLSPYVTVSDYAVTPIVAVMQWPQTLTLQPNEVAHTLTLPLTWLSQRGNFSLRARNTIDPLANSRHPVIVYHEKNNATLWGATARMTLNCLKAFSDGQLSVTPAVDAPIQFG